MNQYIALTSNDSATPALSIPACRWKYSSTLRPIAFVPGLAPIKPVTKTLLN